MDSVKPKKICKLTPNEKKHGRYEKYSRKRDNDPCDKYHKRESKFEN